MAYRLKPHSIGNEISPLEDRVKSGRRCLRETDVPRRENSLTRQVENSPFRATLISGQQRQDEWRQPRKPLHQR